MASTEERMNGIKCKGEIERLVKLQTNLLKKIGKKKEKSRQGIRVL